MKKNIVRENKNLFDEITGDNTFTVINVIAAHLNHIPDHCTHSEEDAPVEAGDRVINQYDLGYPCTAELPDGSLITVYYQSLKGDWYPSVLYTKWKLEERK